MKVLLIEDDLVAGTLLSRVLTADGYDCNWKMTGPDALRAVLDGFLPQAIIADLLLPNNVTGIEIVSAIHNLGNHYKDIPYLIITAAGTAGIHDIPITITVLYKPFTLEALRNAVTKLFQNAAKPTSVLPKEKGQDTV